ncbi:hypothetical protein DL96DRAFT_1473728, partial [Flagelloscypha sp. PMI_526]
LTLTVVPESAVCMSVYDYLKARLITACFHDTLGLSRWTHVHSFVLDMGQFSIALSSGVVEPITSRKQPADYVCNGTLRNEDLPTASRLKELNKTHVLVKTFTLFQVLWFVVQCLARWLSHLPVTLLELVTSCYAL